jgi:hypothetical protein
MKCEFGCYKIRMLHIVGKYSQEESPSVLGSCYGTSRPHYAQELNEQKMDSITKHFDGLAQSYNEAVFHKLYMNLFFD